MVLLSLMKENMLLQTLFKEQTHTCMSHDLPLILQNDQIQATCAPLGIGYSMSL